MKVTEKVQPYNSKRYGKPYVANVYFTDPKSMRESNVEWGVFDGDAEKGGELEIDAVEGDVLMIGQKDFRNPQASKPFYYIVHKDGSLGQPVSRAKAFKFWLKRSGAAGEQPQRKFLHEFTYEELVAEMSRRMDKGKMTGLAELID